ncbi:MAG: Hpt domain-containing protein, partial [Brevundimonas sp.]
QEVASLETALETGDADCIGKVSHSLAGSAGLFGYPAISRAAGEIDALYATGERPSETQVRDLIALVRSVYS